MSILSITTDVAGQVGITTNAAQQPIGGVNPRRVKMVVTDNLATVTTAGYLPVYLQGFTFYPTDIVDMWYGYVSASNPGTLGQFTLSISNGIITLIPYVSSGNVLLPVVSGNLASFNGTTGQIKDSGVSSTNPIFLGNVQAGASGTAGALTSFPQSASSGSFRIAAVNNSGGNFVTTISNPSLTTGNLLVTIPNPGVASANFLLDEGINVMEPGSGFIMPKVNGTEAANAVTANGVAGTITTSVLTTIPGSSYPITWTNSFIHSTSVILLTLVGGSNTLKTITIEVQPSTGSANLTIYNISTLTGPFNGTIIMSYLIM